jgi:hypothetical protein
VSTEITVVKQRGRPFRSGQSGNPNGRPKGARNRATLAVEVLLDGEADALTRKAIELGLAGDTTALRLCLERVLPPRKDRPISLTLPPITGSADAACAIAAVLAAVAEGRITPHEGLTITALIEAHNRAAASDAPAPSSPATLRLSFKPPQDVPLLRSEPL